MPKRANFALTEGHQLLTQSGKGPSALAKVASCSRQLAAKWLEGATPGEQYWPAIQKGLGIPAHAWQTRPSAASRSRKPSPAKGLPSPSWLADLAADAVKPTPPAPTMPKVKGRTIAEQLTHVEGLIAELRAGRDRQPLLHVQRSIRIESQLVDIRAKLIESQRRDQERSEAHAMKMKLAAAAEARRVEAAREVDAKRVMASDAWRQMVAALWETLEPFEDAMAAIRARFGSDEVEDSTDGN